MVDRINLTVPHPVETLLEQLPTGASRSVRIGPLSDMIEYEVSRSVNPDFDWAFTNLSNHNQHRIFGFGGFAGTISFMYRKDRLYDRFGRIVVDNSVSNGEGKIVTAFQPGRDSTDGFVVVIGGQIGASPYMAEVRFILTFADDQTVLWNEDALQHVSLRYEGGRLVGSDTDWLVAMSDFGTDPDLRRIDLEAIRTELETLNNTPVFIQYDSNFYST